MKTTYEKIATFRNLASAYKARRPDMKSKFNYALEKMISRTNAFEKVIMEEIEDKRVELASEDEKKNIIVIDGNYKFTKENTKSLNVFIREQLKKEFEFEPYFSKEKPELSFKECEAFAGFVIEQEMQEPNE